MKTIWVLISVCAVLSVTILGGAALVASNGGGNPIGTPPPAQPGDGIGLPEFPNEPIPLTDILGPGIWLHGKHVPIPADAIIQTMIGEGPGAEDVETTSVLYRGSLLTWKNSDGSVVAKDIKKEDEAALGPLLEELGP